MGGGEETKRNKENSKTALNHIIWHPEMREDWDRRPGKKNSICTKNPPCTHAFGRRYRRKAEIMPILRIRYMKKFPGNSDWLEIPRRAALMKIKSI